MCAQNQKKETLHLFRVLWMGTSLPKITLNNRTYAWLKAGELLS